MSNHGGRTDLQHPTRVSYARTIHRHRHDFLRHPRTIRFVTVVQLKAMMTGATAVARLTAARRTMTVYRTLTLRTDHLDTRHQSLPTQFTWPEFTTYSTA